MKSCFGHAFLSVLETEGQVVSSGKLLTSTIGNISMDFFVFWVIRTEVLRFSKVVDREQKYMHLTKTITGLVISLPNVDQVVTPTAHEGLCRRGRTERLILLNCQNSTVTEHCLAWPISFTGNIIVLQLTVLFPASVKQNTLHSKYQSL